MSHVPYQQGMEFLTVHDFMNQDHGSWNVEVLGEANIVAHTLARASHSYASSKVFFIPPYFIRSKLVDYCEAIDH